MASDPGRPDLRYELKLAGQEASYARLMTVLRLHPAGIRPLFPPRRVQSLYLDTSLGRALEENLAGISHREKLRLRWYGESSVGVRARLECKVRENSLGWKETCEVEGLLDVEGAPRARLVRRLRARVPEGWRARLDGLEPVQWIRYWREYWASFDGRVRLTIDRELEAYDQRGRARLTGLRPRASVTPRLFVLELKCAPEHVDGAAEIAARLPWSIDRCSKFVLASERDHGPVPSIEPR